MRKVLMKGLYGSRLYGTHTPNSDTDIRGIFIPTPWELLMGNGEQIISKATKPHHHSASGVGDIDTTLFTLQSFVEKALSGDTGAFDMLHAPSSAFSQTSPEWEFLRANRSKFYTCKLQGLFGQVAVEAERYGIRGVRATALEEVVKILNTIDIGPDDKLGDIVHLLPLDGNYTRVITDVTQRVGSQQFYIVLDKKAQFTIKAEMFRDQIMHWWKGYGDRTKKIQRGGGVDWKAMGHAVRIGYQLLDIYEKGTYTFPGEHVFEVRDIQAGQWSLGETQDLIQQIIVDVKTASATSGLPEQPDSDFWNNWVFDIYRNTIMEFERA